VRKPGTELN